jgi:hypothetical protein
MFTTFFACNLNRNLIRFNSDSIYFNSIPTSVAYAWGDVPYKIYKIHELKYRVSYIGCLVN